jgi:AraC family transcriptional regulator
MVRKRKLSTARVAGFTLTEGIHPAGSTLPWHTHDGPTICFVLQGAFTEISAGETLDCRPAMLKVTPAGERHWNRFDRGDARGLLIEADPARAEALRPHAAILDQHVAFQGGLPAAIARRIYEELRMMDEAAPLAIEGLLLELLAATTRQGRANGGGRGRPGWVLRARDLLRRLRIERAAVQLGGSDVPLATIALGAGFSDQSHFSNLFRRETGMSPSAYRRAVRSR